MTASRRLVADGPAALERRRAWHIAQITAHDDDTFRLSAALNFLRAALSGRDDVDSAEFTDRAVSALVVLADAALVDDAAASVDLERPAQTTTTTVEL